MYLRCPRCNDVFQTPKIPQGHPVKCPVCRRIFSSHPILAAKPRAPRYGTPLLCEVEGTRGRLVNVSKSGLAVDAPYFEASPGRQVAVSIEIPGSVEPLRFTTRVVRRIGERRWALRITQVNDPRRFERFLRIRAAAVHLAARLKGRI